jgi:RNA polymerase sigma-70 factor (ECF subfamily)
MNDLKEIWLTFSGRFYRIAYYILDSQEDAEDAVQELYLKIFSGSKNMMDVKNPVAYGTTLLRNICIDRIRRRDAVRTEEIQEYIVSDTSGPDEASACRDALKFLLQEMEKLPEKQSRALRMRAFEGLEYQEIAKRMRLSQVNVRVLISIARKQLKRRMNR